MLRQWNESPVFLSHLLTWYSDWVLFFLIGRQQISEWDVNCRIYSANICVLFWFDDEITPNCFDSFFEIAKKCLTPIKSTMHNLRTKKVDLENSVVNCDRTARSYSRIEFCYSAQIIDYNNSWSSNWINSQLETECMSIF